MDNFWNTFLSLFQEKNDRFSRKKKDGTIKISPFCSKEYAESIGTVRWKLTSSNVEIIDSIYFFKNGQFLPNKVNFLENSWSDRAQKWCADARDNFGKMNFEKGVHMRFFFSKENAKSLLIIRKTIKIERLWCVINILKESFLKSFTSVNYRSE